MNRDLVGRRASRGAGLIEALIAFAVLAVSVLAAMRIQATWRIAEEQAQLHRVAARALQHQLESWLAGAAPAAPASDTLGNMATRLHIVPVAAAVAEDSEAIVDWGITLRSHHEPEQRLALRTQRFVLPPPVLANWSSTDPGQVLDIWAPGHRQPAMDIGFGLPQASPTPSPLTTDRPLRPARELATHHGAAGRGAGPLCGSADLDAVLSGRAAASGCDPRRHATRAGVIRWSAQVLRDAELQRERAAWLALVIRPPSERIHWREVGDAQCAVDADTLSQGLMERTTAWRCLGSAWTPATAVSPTTTTASDDPSGLSLPIANRAIDPLRGLPAGLRACRYPRGEVDARHASATAAIWQHERIHWWVGPATAPCPGGTTPVRRLEPGALT